MSPDQGTVLIANPGADLYGSDRMVVENVKALRAAGYRVVVTVPESGPLIQLLDQAGAEVTILPTPVIRKSLLSVRGLWLLIRQTLRSLGGSCRLIKQVNPGTILVNTITPPLWLPLGRLLGRRVVCHVHEAEGSASRWLRWALYLPLICCHAIVINSAYARDVLAASAPWLTGRTSIVHNVVAGPDQVQPAREELDDPVELLFVGRLSHRKGPHVAIEAVHLLHKRGRAVHLGLLGAVFPGNEGYEQQLHQQVHAAGLDDRVTFHGFRSPIWPTVARADIVVICSTVDEPFGNTAVEAALAARPLIVSDIAGLKEASRFTSSAIAVPAADAAAIADAVQTIVENWAEYRRRATTDAETVAAKFGFDRYATGLLAGMGLGVNPTNR